ncbi:MAG TPA: hypothetical protein PKE20_14700, partial [Promineifilum sp.]|nr:hypothetical protein [Promineifilum sp.]
MDHPQRAIAVLAVTDEHANSNDVVDLVETAALQVHLAVNGVEVLGAPGDVGLNASIAQRLEELTFDRLDIRR